MAPRIAWLLNLDADLELQSPATYRGRMLTRDRIIELRTRMFDLVADDDVILDASNPRRRVVEDVDDVDAVLAFCPTPSAREAITRHDLPAPAAPSFDILRRVNDRKFCAQLGHTLPGSAFVESIDALTACLKATSPTGSHVIKRAFSFAGREQRRVHDGVLDASTRGFCERSFEAGEGVQVEPWMDRIADFSLHGYVKADGGLLIDEPRAQLNDAMGRYQSMQSDAATLTSDERATLFDEIKRTASALHDAQYFGPFGIDAFRYRNVDGSLALNPRCEINARFTMGYPRALLLRVLAGQS